MKIDRLSSILKVQCVSQLNTRAISLNKRLSCVGHSFLVFGLKIDWFGPELGSRSLRYVLDKDSLLSQLIFNWGKLFD